MANTEELQRESSKENKETSLQCDRFYALYEYRANRPYPNSKEQNDSSPDTSTVSDLLNKDATLNGDLSLSSLLTSLPAESEAELRKFIAKRLSRGSVYSGTGVIAVIDFGLSNDSETPAACYYCLLRREGAESEETESDSGVCSKDYVVCFITHAEDGALDLGELDKYSEELLNQLHSQVPVIKTEDYLSNWYTYCVEYVSRCVSTLGDDLRYLLNIAMNNWQIKISGGGELLSADITKFVECCSLSEILKHTQTRQVSSDDKVVDDMLLVDFNNDMEFKEIERQTVTMTIGQGSFSFSNTECTKFCKDWAEALRASNTASSVQLRQIIDSYRLQEINYMNELKRLIRQAENDHYALYRAFTFLKTCGNGLILLRYAKLDHMTVSADAKDVLKVLEEYIKETGALS